MCLLVYFFFVCVYDCHLDASSMMDLEADGDMDKSFDRRWTTRLSCAGASFILKRVALLRTEASIVRDDSAFGVKE